MKGFSAGTVGNGNAVHAVFAYGERKGQAACGKVANPAVTDGEDFTCRSCQNALPSWHGYVDALLADAYDEAVAMDEERSIYRAANDIPAAAVVNTSVELAHAEALEHAEVIEFEQDLFNQLRVEGWKESSVLEMVEGARVPGVPWSDPTDATRRYDELLARHGGAVLFLAREDWRWWNDRNRASTVDAG